MNKLTATFLLCTAVLLSACTQSTAKTPATSGAGTAINAKCPITGELVDPQIETVSLQGHTIGFCCAKCPPKFEAMSEADRVAALAKNGTELPK